MKLRTPSDSFTGRPVKLSQARLAETCVIPPPGDPAVGSADVSHKSAKDFFRPLAVGAPAPLREIPARPSRAIHFFDPSNEKMAAKIPGMIGTVDVLLGNLEDAIKADNKVAAREGLVKIAQSTDFGPTQLWTRINALDSPWVLDDLTTLVPAIGDKLDVIMVPKVQGAEDIHFVDRLLAQLEAKAGLTRPILVHAILETARGVANVEEICGASPRMQGLSLGPADLAADRKMKTTRVGGGHPGYLVREDPPRDELGVSRVDAPRATYQQDLWHYTIAKMVDACAMHGIYPYYGPFGDIADTVACEDQFRNAFLLGCVGTWSLHPKQIAIANKVFSPSVDDIAHARRVVAAMGDGTGAVMIDGKMEDDASLKQCLVLVELAEKLAEIDPELKAAYDAIPAEGVSA
ncbi:CoA ester lyase [Nocardioides antri]|uniref:CoA ester lyase n=1 Tax=Nocardioides antri TaxID=2607659 RepID=A0A5B1M3X0_9ACTN|nr:CoA ester lyase [Nocardioides antri]